MPSKNGFGNSRKTGPKMKYGQGKNPILKTDKDGIKKYLENKSPKELTAIQKRNQLRLKDLKNHNETNFSSMPTRIATSDTLEGVFNKQMLNLKKKQ